MSSSTAIKEYFHSRWGSEGCIVECDYSQLEVVVAAALSRDPQLIADIKAGVSMHCMSAHFLTGRPYEEMLRQYNEGDKWAERQRRLGKDLSFELQYGAGPHSMAKKHKLPLEKTEGFVENYYTRYCGVKAWQECVQAEVEGTARHAGDMLGPTPVRRGTYRAPTGQRFTLVEEPTGRREPSFSFKPTKVKNYPVQGTACTAVVLPSLGALRRALMADPELRQLCKMILMVHDSVVLDCHKSVLDRAAHLIHTVFEGAPERIQNTLGVKWDLALPVEIEAGPTLGSLTRIYPT